MDGTTDNMASVGSDSVVVQLPSNLVAQIDAQVSGAFGAFIDRQDFIRSAVRHYLESMRASSGLGASQVDGG